MLEWLLAIVLAPIWAGMKPGRGRNVVMVLFLICLASGIYTCVQVATVVQETQQELDAIWDR